MRYRQKFKRLSQTAGALALHYSIEHRTFSRRQTGGCRFSRHPGDRLVQTFRADTAQMVERQISRHGEKPSFEIALRIVLPDLFRHAYPSLLKEIFRLRRLANQTQQIAVEAILIACQQRGKRVQVSALKLGYFAFEPHTPLPHNGCAAYHIHTTDELRKKTQSECDETGVQMPCYQQASLRRVLECFYSAEDSSGSARIAGRGYASSRRPRPSGGLSQENRGGRSADGRSQSRARKKQSRPTCHGKRPQEIRARRGGMERKSPQVQRSNLTDKDERGLQSSAARSADGRRTDRQSGRPFAGTDGFRRRLRPPY